MENRINHRSQSQVARVAGVLYLVIIVAGIWAFSVVIFAAPMKSPFSTHQSAFSMSFPRGQAATQATGSGQWMQRAASAIASLAV